MREPLYMALSLAGNGPDTTYFDELVDGHVHSIGLSDYKHIWDFISLVDHRYVGGLYLPDNKLAECANGYQSYTATPTGFADTIWWNSEVGVVCGTDSAYEMMVDTVIPLLLGKSDVMAAVLGTGRMAKAAAMAMYPVCIYLNIVSRGDSATASDIDMALDSIAEQIGKVTCVVEGTTYENAALEPMDVIVNATTLPVCRILPGYVPRPGQKVIDLPVDSNFRMGLRAKVAGRWTNAGRDEQLRRLKRAMENESCHS